MQDQLTVSPKVLFGGRNGMPLARVSSATKLFGHHHTC